MTDTDITDIEIKLAYQEDLLNKLNDVVIRQQQQIDNLELTCKTLIDRIADMAETSGSTAHSPIDEKPPHY